MKNSNFKDQYWATLPVKELLPELGKRIVENVTYNQDTGRMDIWQRSYMHFYGMGVDSSANSQRLTATGDNGEITAIKINDYRSLVNQATTIVTQDRPALKCRAENNDAQSKRECGLGDELVTYFLRQKGCEKDLKNVARLAMLFGESYLLSLWNQELGPVTRVIQDSVDPETQEITPGKAIKTGDLEHKVFGPWDVTRDVRLRNAKAPWHIFRVQVNRWDLIAQYPAFETDIKNVSTPPEYVPSSYNFATPLTNDNTDLIDSWVFIHDRSPALSEGRFTLFVGDVALNDGPLPYKHSPVSRLSPGEQYETSFGYTDAWDLMAIQSLRDAITTIIASNEVTFGGQNIAVKKGWGGSKTQLGTGFNLFELENPATDIVPLTLVKTSPELFNFEQRLDQKQGQLIGLNQTVRGEPQENLKSGSALALVDSKAMQFLSGLQENYNSLLEDFGNNLIEILQAYADEPILIQIAGKSYRSVLKDFKFTKDNIKNITRVICEQVNSLSQTFSGRLQIATDLLGHNLIKNAEQYIQVLETGRLEPITGSELAPLYAIDSENEALMEGKPVKALITDMHKEHIQSHRQLVDDPEIRFGDPKFTNQVLEHIKEHLDLLQQVAQQNPLLLWATGQEMPPMSAPQGNPSPQGQQHPTAMPNGKSSIPNQMNPQPQVERNAQGVALPKMPKIAGTNQRAPGSPTDPNSSTPT